MFKICCGKLELYSKLHRAGKSLIIPNLLLFLNNIRLNSHLAQLVTQIFLVILDSIQSKPNLTQIVLCKPTTPPQTELNNRILNINIVLIIINLAIMLFTKQLTSKISLQKLYLHNKRSLTKLLNEEFLFTLKHITLCIHILSNGV